MIDTFDYERDFVARTKVGWEAEAAGVANLPAKIGTEREAPIGRHLHTTGRRQVRGAGVTRSISGDARPSQRLVVPGTAQANDMPFSHGEPSLLADNMSDYGFNERCASSNLSRAACKLSTAFFDDSAESSGCEVCLSCSAAA